MLAGVLLVAAFWALVALLTVRASRRQLTYAAAALLVLLVIALAVQPSVNGSGWAALALTVALVAVGYARGGASVDGDFDDD